MTLENNMKNGVLANMPKNQCVILFSLLIVSLSFNFLSLHYLSLISLLNPSHFFLVLSVSNVN